MKNLKKFNGKIAALLLVTLPNLVFGAGLKELVEEINNWIQDSFVKPMLVLVIIAIGIYMAKNHDRIKEIWVMCVIIIIAVLIILNAGAIANWIGDAAGN